MKIFAKFTDKLRKLGKKGKALICASITTIGAAAMTVCASAAETDVSAVDTNTVLADAGTQISNSFNSLVSTMIPVILGILGSGLVIFGIFALVKLAKKIFGKVAG